MGFPPLISLASSGVVIYLALVLSLVASRPEDGSGWTGPPTLLSKILAGVWILWFVALAFI